MPDNDPKKRETLWTKAKNEAKYQDESDWCAGSGFCCMECCGNADGGMFQFDAPADGAETLPAILISPGFSHVSMERV